LVGVRGLPLRDDFSAGNLRGWTIAPNANVAWDVRGETLAATAGAAGGYAYALASGLVINGDEVSLEFDTRFEDGAMEGGLIFRGRVLQVNPTVCGWDDSSPRFVVACPMLTPDTWHRVALDIRSTPLGLVSDLFIDGVPVFYDEPVEPGTPSAAFGFLSPYWGGTVRWDNAEVYNP